MFVIYNFKDHNQKRAIDACIAGSQKLEKPMTVPEAKIFFISLSFIIYFSILVFVFQKMQKFLLLHHETSYLKSSFYL